MRAKIIVSTLLLAVHIHYAKAQDIFDRGYLIKNNGDSLNGYLLYNGAPTRYFQLQYKKGANTEATMVVPFDIVRFKVGENLFIKEIIYVNEPSINPYFKSIGLYTHKIECFLRKIASGPILDLYCYNGSKQRYFIRIKRQNKSVLAHPFFQELVYWNPDDYTSSSPFEHIDITPYRHIDSQMVQKKGRSLWYFGYRRQLNSFLKDSAEQPFKNLPFIESYLVSAVQYINEGNSWTPPAELRDVAASVFIAVGAGTSKAKVIQTHDEKMSASFPWQTFPLLAAGVELQAPKGSLSFCARIQLLWCHYKTGQGAMDLMTNPTNYYFDFDIQSFGLGVAPTWRIDEQWGPFGLYIGSEATLEQLFFSTNQFGNNINGPIQSPFDAKFKKMMISLGLYVMLKTEKFALTIQAPLVSTKVYISNIDFMMKKKQWEVSLSYNLFGPKNSIYKESKWKNNRFSF